MEPDLWSGKNLCQSFRTPLSLSRYLCQQSRRLVQASMVGEVDPEELKLLRGLAHEREDYEWHLRPEFDLARFETSGTALLRSLGSPECHQHSQPVLHTRLVPNEEVRENLSAWAPAMELEFRSLLAKGAIEEVSDDEVRQWIHAGKDVEILPGRGAPTQKPATQPGGLARNKYRPVICGNFQKPTGEKEGQSFYAGGADSVSIRALLRWSGLRGFGASCVDIRTAFLNAPVDAAEPEFLVCSPPKHMVLAGVVPPRSKWHVKGALYGLNSSPRSWSCFRDSRMREFKWTQGEDSRVLRPCMSDPNVWLIKDLHTGTTIGAVCCHVDDSLVVGDRIERDAFLARLRSVWECSQAEHAESGPISYCGLEIGSTPDGLRVTQGKYVRELLQRHAHIKEPAQTPCTGWKESYDDADTDKGEHPADVQ